ncbi:MAG: amidase family protein [Alphaproteobacteria bacterium]|nr:amidase family protein [Alphaproteobacteria bacterium]
MNRDLLNMPATKVVDLLKRGEVAPAELIDLAEKRIAEVDGTINATVTKCFDRARAKAADIDKAMDIQTSHAGWLAGLPVLVKDLNEVEGVRTTYGSTIFADFIPKRSDAMVELLERRGAIVIGKSNTPEFGAGANTFNDVFGATVNPWNTKMSVGGSSGGSAAALATGQCWLATGSDFGGSLRTPAAFCGIVGMRPGPGRVPRAPTTLPFADLGVEGPMARTVSDLALMMDAMVGPDGEDPISREAPGYSFQSGIKQGLSPKRIAFTPDLGGLGPVDPEVASICANAMRLFEGDGVGVDLACPDLSGLIECFKDHRAVYYAGALKPLLEQHRDKLKPEVIWNIESGYTMTGESYGDAMRERARLFNAMAHFFETYDLLALPTAIVPPYPVEQRYVEEVNGHVFDSYIDWVYPAFLATMCSLPAISVPCGMTESGLPVGLQLVGKPRGERALLAAARRFEEAAGLLGDVPLDPKTV